MKLNRLKVRMSFIGSNSFQFNNFSHLSYPDFLISRDPIVAKKSFFSSFIVKPLVALACLGLLLSPCVAEAKSKKKAVSHSKPYIPPSAYLVLDADTGIVISQSNADQALYPASLTKLMTLLLTFEALDARKISLSSPVVMSSHAASMPPSRIGLRPGESLSVNNAIKALVTKSANDVAVAMGEKLGGSESRFAQIMTQKAKQIGMKQTSFVNASGLFNSRQKSSARDMAKLALYILRNYPHYYAFFSIEEFYFNGKVNHNHNRLMGSYRGMDGMKTGYVAQSGFNLVASAKRDGVRLIGVVFGGRTANSRNAQMASLLDDGFSRIGSIRRQNPQIASAKGKRSSGQILAPSAPVEQPSSLIPPRKPDEIASAGNLVQAQQSYLSKPTNVRANPAYDADEEDGREEPQTSQPVTALATPITPAPMKTIGSVPSTSATRSSPTNSQGEFIPAMPAVGWSIQIGAYQDRSSTDQALYKAIQKLPSPLNRGTAIIVPLKTSDSSWVFRARIGGYTKEQALQACRYLDDCLTISPSSN